jgi:hypothetical protein
MWRRIPFEPHLDIFPQPTLKSGSSVNAPVLYYENYFTSELIYEFAKMTNIYAYTHYKTIQCSNQLALLKFASFLVYTCIRGSTNFQGFSSTGLRLWDWKSTVKAKALQSVAEQPTHHQ